MHLASVVNVHPLPWRRKEKHLPFHPGNSLCQFILDVLLPLSSLLFLSLFTFTCVFFSLSPLFPPLFLCIHNFVQMYTRTQTNTTNNNTKNNNDMDRDVKVVAQSSTSLVVSWKPPPGSERTVTGYYVGYKLIHSLSSSSPSSSSSLGPPASSPAKSISTSASPGREESFAYKTVEASPGKASDEHCVLSGLRRHSKYEVIVQAFNAKGAGPPSDHSEGHTLEFGKRFALTHRKVKVHFYLLPLLLSSVFRVLLLFFLLFSRSRYPRWDGPFAYSLFYWTLTVLDPPEAPSLQIESSTSASLLVTWEAKDTNPILGFYLFHKSEATEWQEVSLPAKSSEYNLTGLSCGRRYHLYLIAFNDAGRGPPSEVISAKTDGSC